MAFLEKGRAIEEESDPLQVWCSASVECRFDDIAAEVTKHLTPALEPLYRGITAVEKDAAYSRAASSICSLYAAQSLARLPEDVEGTLRSLDSSITDLTRLAWRAASLVSAVNRTVLDVAPEFQLSRDEPMQTVVLLSCNIGNIFTIFISDIPMQPLKS